MFNDWLETEIYHDLGKIAYFKHVADEHKENAIKGLLISLFFVILTICILYQDPIYALIFAALGILFFFAAYANYREYREYVNIVKEEKRKEEKN